MPQPRLDERILEVARQAIERNLAGSHLPAHVIRKVVGFQVPLPTGGPSTQ